MKTSILVKNILFIAMFAVLLSPIFNISPVVLFPALVLCGMVNHIVKVQTGFVLFDGLAPEVWIPLIKENPYPANSFMQSATDMSALVDYDSINFAEAGGDPDVLVDNTTFPIPESVASDSPLRVTLKTYDTTSTIVRNAVAIELAYDQRALYANKHKKALAKKIGLDAAYAYAPTAANAGNFNTVLSLGASDSLIDAVIDLQAAYNGFDDDGTNRNLVFNPLHLAKIAKEDKVLYKAIMAEPGSIFYGFKVWTYSKNPIYIASTGVKAAFGAAYVGGTHKYASFSFLGGEVMAAQGTVEMFSRLKDPDVKGDKFNFQMRALALPLRAKFQGAILQ